MFRARVEEPEPWGSRIIIPIVSISNDPDTDAEVAEPDECIIDWDTIPSLIADLHRTYEKCREMNRQYDERNS